jgi:hypothetical protein
MNWPDKKNFKFTMPGAQEPVVYQTSDHSDTTPVNEMQNVSVIGCKTNKDITDAGEWYLRLQMQAMAKRVGHGTMHSKADQVWSAIDGQDKLCSRFDKVKGSFDEGIAETSEDMRTNGDDPAPKAR